MLSKITKRLLLSIIVTTFFGAQADDRGGNTPNQPSDSGAENITLIKDYISDYENEYIDIRNLTVQLNYNDVEIPGNNGMDIVITRKQKGYNGGRFSLNSSTLIASDYPVGSPGASQPKTNFGCFGEKHRLTYRKNGRLVNPMGYGSASDIPVNTLVAFDDSSVLVCEGTPELPTLIFPNGRKYIYSLTGRLIETKDRFGNSITYSNIVNNKQTITRNDGQIVELIYEQVYSTDAFLTKIKYNNKTIEYKYND